jgi:hypothetical protein
MGVTTFVHKNFWDGDNANILELDSSHGGTNSEFSKNAKLYSEFCWM